MEWLEKILNEVENKEELIKSIKKAIGENFMIFRVISTFCTMVWVIQIGRAHV